MIKTLPDVLMPLSKEAWAKLTPKEQWDVKVALRGPDLANSTLKVYTTAIIRWVCSNAMRTGGTINSFCPVIMLPKDLYALSRGEETTWGFDLYHFMLHIQEAATILKIPTVDLTRTTWEEAFGNNVSAKDFYNLLLDDLSRVYLSNPKPLVAESLWAVLENKKTQITAESRYIDKLFNEDEDADNDE